MGKSISLQAIVSLGKGNEGVASSFTIIDFEVLQLFESVTVTEYIPPFVKVYWGFEDLSCQRYLLVPGNETFTKSGLLLHNKMSVGSFISGDETRDILTLSTTDPQLLVAVTE